MLLTVKFIGRWEFDFPPIAEPSDYFVVWSIDRNSVGEKSFCELQNRKEIRFARQKSGNQNALTFIVNELWPLLIAPTLHEPQIEQVREWFRRQLK